MPYPLPNEYADRIDKDNWGRNFDPSDEEHCTEKRTTGHVLHALVVYRSNKWQDRLLWGYFQEDFAGWKQETFEMAENADVRALRDHMRMYGVYAPKDGRRIAANLAEIVEQDEYHEWTEDEVNHHLRHYTEFHSRWNPRCRSSTPPPQPTAPPAPQGLWSQHPPPPLPPHPRYQTTPSSSSQAATPIYSSIEQPPPAAPEAQPQWPQRLDPLGQTIYCSGSTPAPSSSKQLIDLQKLYTDDKKKYSGERYDALDSKLRVFYNYCTIVALPQDQLPYAYPAMLTGRASDFYFEKLANRALTINQLVTSTKTRFETEENQQLYLSEWQTTSLEQSC